MVEQSQTAQAAAEAAAASAAGAQAAAADAAARANDALKVSATPNPAASLGNLSYGQLQARLNELRSLRGDLADRRTALANGFERATGANQAGMASRLQILDNNIVLYEAEISAVGREMAIKAQSRPGVQGGPVAPGFSEGDMVAGIFSTFLGTVLLTVLFLRRFSRRRWENTPRHTEPASIQSGERLDRIEQAVDTIAVEIERVSENQRFMTRLMTETQLGASIAAVRSSTEMAKSAGEAG